LNIKADIFKASLGDVKGMLYALDGAVQSALESAAKLKLIGVDFARRSGLDIGVVGEPFYWLGQVEAGIGEAAKGLQGLHASLHEALQRLSPTEERSGPGDKTPPPKP